MLNHILLSFVLIAIFDIFVDIIFLYHQGYAKEQCEAWLGTIRKKYKRMEREPEYWECLAALEEAKGNITSAVECYRNAIVQGAEVSLLLQINF